MSPVPPATSSSLKGCPSALGRIEPCHKGILPEPVHATAHQIIHHVIAICDMVKDLVDPRLLFPFSDLFEAERSGHFRDLFRALFILCRHYPRPQLDRRGGAFVILIMPDNSLSFS